MVLTLPRQIRRLELPPGEGRDKWLSVKCEPAEAEEDTHILAFIATNSLTAGRCEECPGPAAAPCPAPAVLSVGPTQGAPARQARQGWDNLLF